MFVRGNILHPTTAADAGDGGAAMATDGDAVMLGVR